jgi:hypothetical protein
VSRYAEQTGVPSDRSQAEIERTLARYGADQFMRGWTNEAAVLAFRCRGKMVRFHLPLPARTSVEFTHTPERGLQRNRPQQEAAYEQAVRQRWRALALVIKAKLEAVECGITSFEDEFMAHLLLPDGQTVGAFMTPQIEEAYATGLMPTRLPALLTAGHA